MNQSFTSYSPARISENDNIPFEIRVKTHLELLSRIYGRAGVTRAAETLGLTQHLDKRYSELSRGLQRRLALVEALASDRELIIIDDPMIGMDSQGRRLIGGMLSDKASSGASNIVISHMLVPGLEPGYLVRVEDGLVSYGGRFREDVLHGIL